MIHLINFPELRQIYNYDCGACASQCILEYYGFDVREDTILKRLKTDPEEGSSWKRIVRLFNSYGLKTQHGVFDINMLIESINNLNPVLIALQAYRDNKNINWEKDFNDGHYVTAIGYTKKNIIFEDLSSVNRTYLSYDELNERWHDIDPSTNKVLEHFGIKVYGLEPKFHTKYLVKLE